MRQATRGGLCALTARRLALAAVCLLVACAPVEWMAVIEGESAGLEWPPAPNPLKVRYLGEIRGFKEIGRSLAGFLVGTSKTAGKIIKPVAVTVGLDGRIAVADLGRRAVHLYIPAEKKYRLIYQTGTAELQSPVGVTFDDSLRLYVADSVLQKVFVFDPAGTIVKEIVAAGQTAFKRPTGLAFQKKDGLLYIVDTGLHQIHIFSAESGYRYSFGTRGIGEGEFNVPTHIGAGPDGRLYINDTMNFRVQIFEPQKGFVAKFGRHGNGSGDFAMPKGVGVDRWGIIYVVDTLFDNVQLFDQEGHFLLTIGGRGYAAGEFWLPNGLFIDHQDRLYVCDTYNQRVEIFQLFDNQLEDGLASAAP